MIIEIALAAVLAVASLFGAGHNGQGKGHYDYQGRGLGHLKHGDGDRGCRNSHCDVPDCLCSPPCVPNCDGGTGGGI